MPTKTLLCILVVRQGVLLALCDVVLPSLSRPPAHEIALWVLYIAQCSAEECVDDGTERSYLEDHIRYFCPFPHSALSACWFCAPFLCSPLCPCVPSTDSHPCCSCLYIFSSLFHISVSCLSSVFSSSVHSLPCFSSQLLLPLPTAFFQWYHWDVVLIEEPKRPQRSLRGCAKWRSSWNAQVRDYARSLHRCRNIRNTRRAILSWIIFCRLTKEMCAVWNNSCSYSLLFVS